MSTSGNVLVDLDGTLAHYTGWKSPEHIGEPIAPMLAKVKAWIADGKTVKLFTARANTPECIPHIRGWLDKHGLEAVKEITAAKDFTTSEIYDDRAYGVQLNVGITREAMMAYHLSRVAKVLGISIDKDSDPERVTKLCTGKILQMTNALTIAHANVDAAADALRYVKADFGGQRSDLNRAKQTLDRALKPIGDALTGLPH